MQRYIIIGIPRSGTTAVHLLLKGHPQVSATNDEIKVSPLFDDNISTFTYGNDTPKEKEKGLVALFDTITTLESDEKTIAHGMKLAISNPEDAAILVDGIRKIKDVKIVFVERMDLVAQMGSGKLAYKTGRLHSWAEAKNNEEFQLTLDENKFLIRMCNYMKTIQVVKQLQSEFPFFIYQYDDLKEPKYKDLFEFLNLEITSPSWFKSGKVAPSPEEYLINYHQLKELQVYYENNFTELEKKVESIIKKKEKEARSVINQIKKTIKSIKNK